jgi:hypothetical protein
VEINSNFKDLLRSLNEGGVSLDDLIAAKQAAGRRKDRLQVRQLRAAKARHKR